VVKAFIVNQNYKAEKESANFLAGSFLFTQPPTVGGDFKVYV
jgi:hypothetical protein